MAKDRTLSLYGNLYLSGDSFKYGHLTSYKSSYLNTLQSHNLITKINHITLSQENIERLEKKF
jgi:hypothetical protein